MPSPEPHVSFRRVPATLDRAQLETFAALLRTSVAADRDLHCLITTDSELRRLNARFLEKDYATDVLSFPESGDIAVSYPRALSQAREFGHSLEDEIRILMLHGALHLMGMDHESDNGRMARAETHWRKKFGLPMGLIARANA